MPTLAGTARRIGTLLILALALVAVGCDGEGEVQILSIDPAAGAMQGEQPIRIGGRHFRSDIGYTVYFGSQKAGSVTILNENELMATTPPGTEPGAVDVTIRADDGPAFRIAGGFRYENVGGNVMEQVGEAAQQGEGNLAY